MSVNQARLSGVLVSLSVLRYTPAGVAVTTLEIDHASTVEQAGSHRAIAFNLEATALGDAALATSHLQLGQHYAFDGFWAPAHYRTKRLGFHITQVVGAVEVASLG
jgi:primosomal replication protein N